MKKVNIVLVIIMMATLFFVPLTVSAKTIKDYEAEVNKFTKELQDKQSKIVTNNNEVAKIKANIAKIQTEIKELQVETVRLQQEIDESNIEIQKKSEENKALFQYLQVSDSSNAYLEYIFESTSITDMVYRISIVEQLTEHNEKIMNELKQLIETNKQKKIELSKKQDELNAKTKELEKERDRINEETSSIRDSIPSVQSQIKEAKANLDYYKSLGCGATEDIYACQFRKEQASGSNVPLVSREGFHRPMVNGYVTQNWGGLGGHLGMDLSNTNKTMPIYAIADGILFRKTYDANGALLVIIRHNVGGRYIYSMYAHLSSWANVSEGQYVTPNTLIGYMGNTGYSFGAHLHLELATCHWVKGGGCTWASYQSKTVNPRNYVSFPGLTNPRTWWYDR